MELVTIVNWNQTSADWDMLLRQGRGLGIRLPGGRLVATSVALRYPPHAGWISMVIVDPDYRGLGLARRLLEAAVEGLERDGCVPALDATPLGRAVYSRLGFKEFATVTRWRGSGGGKVRVGEDRCPASRDEIAAASSAALDVFGYDNSPALKHIAARGWLWAMPEERVFAWARAGREAVHLGPLIARSEADAIRFCAMALDELHGSIVLDVPDQQLQLAAFLESRRFARERGFHRMGRAPSGSLRLNDSLRVTAGPELG